MLLEKLKFLIIANKTADQIQGVLKMGSREKLEATLKIMTILMAAVMSFEGVIPKTYFIYIMAGLVALYMVLGTIERCVNPTAELPALPPGIPVLPGMDATTTKTETTSILTSPSMNITGGQASSASNLPSGTTLS